MFNVNKWGLKISQFWPRVVKKQYVTRFHDITGYSSIICTHIVVNRNLLCISCHLSHFRGLGLGLKYVDTTIKTTKYYGGCFCNFLGLMDLSSIFFKKKRTLIEKSYDANRKILQLGDCTTPNSPAWAQLSPRFGQCPYIMEPIVLLAIIALAFCGAQSFLNGFH